MKKVGEKVNRKYAVAVYVSHRHAAMARRYLILRKNEIFQQYVVVDWASPNIRLDQNDGQHDSPTSNENVSRLPSANSFSRPNIP